MSEKYSQSPYDYVTGDPLRFAFDYTIAIRAGQEREMEKAGKGGRLTDTQKRIQMDRMRRQFPELDALVKAARDRADASRN